MHTPIFLENIMRYKYKAVRESWIYYTLFLRGQHKSTSPLISMGPCCHQSPSSRQLSDRLLSLNSRIQIRISYVWSVPSVLSVTMHRSLRPNSGRFKCRVIPVRRVVRANFGLSKSPSQWHYGAAIKCTASLEQLKAT